MIITLTSGAKYVSELIVTVSSQTNNNYYNNSSIIELNETQLLEDIMGDDLIRLSNNQLNSTQTVKLKRLKYYITKFNSLNSLILHPYDDLVKEMYLLHYTAKSLYLFNEKRLKLTQQQFRMKILYPNLIYMLIRLSPFARKFLHNTIKFVYNQIKKKSYSIINAFTNSIYSDEDVIKTDILYEFLGNGLRKLNPLEVRDVNAFYSKVFRNIFDYYFKKEQKLHATMTDVWNIQEVIDTHSRPSTRLSIYRDVLYNIQIEKMYKRSPTISQIWYNFSIFRNIVIPNEFQNIYFSTMTDINILNSDEYKLIKFYDDDLLQKEFLEEIKKLPIIYQLLRCIHINNPTTKAYNEMLIKPDAVKHAVLEELIYPFKNFFQEDIIYDILNKIASNFTTSILNGEYINPLTLSVIKINHLTFLTQLKKFINLCIGVVKNDPAIRR